MDQLSNEKAEIVRLNKNVSYNIIWFIISTLYT